MVHRVNVMFEDHIWQSLSQVPSGERSKAVNEAVSAWLIQQRRTKAAAEMDKLRAKAKPVDSKEIVEMLRRDRKRSK